MCVPFISSRRIRATAVAGVLLLSSGCATKNLPLTNLEVPLPTVPIPGLPLLGPGENDLRFMRWERAFDKMHARIQREYPYTEWKGIDWDALYAEVAPQVASAQENRDAEAWYDALRAYAAGIPDDKVQLSANAGTAEAGTETDTDTDTDTDDSDPDFFESILEEPIDSRLLPEGPGYVRLRFFAPSLTTPFPGRAFSRALTQLSAASANALILDLRGNPGGADELAAEFAGHFTTWQEEAPPVLCKYAEYNHHDGAFVTERIYPVSPVDPHVDLPVVILVDGSTAGAAETFSVFLQRRGATVLGREASRGSAGAPGGTLLLPKGHTLTYPTGRALDGDDLVLVERDADGHGGVQPDVLAKAEAEEGSDTLLDEAIAYLAAR